VSSTINSALRQDAADVERALAAASSGVSALLKQDVAEATSSLGGLATTVSEAIRDSAQGIEQSLNHLLTTTTEAIRSSTQDAEHSLGNLSQSTSEAIRTSALDAERSLTGASSGVTAAMKQNAGDLERSLTQLAAATGEALRTTADEATRKIAATSGEVTGAIKRGTGEAERALTTVATGVNATLKQNAGEVERTLLGVSAEVARGMTAKAEELTANINQRGTDLRRVLDEKTGVFLSTFGAQGQKFSTEIERITHTAVQSIEAKGVTFAKSMTQNSEEITSQINEASSRASAQISRTVGDLDTTARAAIERSQKAASAAVTEMMETHGMLRNDTSALFERLREANVLLQEVLGGATENLSTIETTLSGRVAEFVTTMNDIGERSGAVNSRFEDQMKSFHGGTATILRDIASAADKFDVQGKALAAAAEQIDTSNRRTEEVLTDRREALDSVVNQIDSKVGDLDQRLKRFSALLAETFEAAEGRARDIARVLAESSTDSTKAIANQYELVRVTSDEERKRTSEALHSIYEQATGETSALFRQTSERFIEIVRQMREMSAAMAREMEQTRTELRKGILELPQETADSAAQMRRVIVEQIDALAELNRIVARHGGATEQPARRAEPMAATGRAEPRPARLEQAGGRSNAPPRRTEPQAPAPAQEGRGGWLTDLLGRASRDDGEPVAESRQARNAMESLDSLSVDIARMIDHDAAAELWERYKRGERNVFTRRLYTLQGQKTFEEIRKRYRGDREFKTTVDRYIGEFERLLNEVSQDERGQATARQYLTSDTGKVYTMLAHAAGRFE